MLHIHLECHRNERTEEVLLYKHCEAAVKIPEGFWKESLEVTKPNHLVSTAPGRGFLGPRHQLLNISKARDSRTTLDKPCQCPTLDNISIH